MADSAHNPRHLSSDSPWLLVLPAAMVAISLIALAPALNVRRLGPAA